MSPRARSLLVTGALFSVLFAGGLSIGYVYQHEPTRNTLEVRLTNDGAPTARTLTGTITRVEAGRIVLSTASGAVTVALPSNVAVDELVRAAEGLANGARVNVGVQSTQYGLVLTGVVAVEGGQ